MFKQNGIVDCKFEIVDEIKKEVVKDNIFVEKSTSKNNSLSTDFMNDEILIPKDSTEILSELIPGTVIATEKLEFSKTVMATVKINDSTYVECGKTHSLAAQAAAESALKDLFFEQIKSTMYNDDDFQYNTNSWKLLGSLAMFKLIEEWMKFYMSNNKYKNSFEISIPQKTTESSNNLLSQNRNVEDVEDVNKKDLYSSKKQDFLLKSDEANTIEKKKPQSIIKENKAVVKHKKNNSQKLILSKIITDSTNACGLLNETIKSNLKFIDLHMNKDQPPFIFSIILDGMEFMSDPAGSKKEAKQNVAKKVLINKFGYTLKKQ